MFSVSTINVTFSYTSPNGNCTGAYSATLSSPMDYGAAVGQCLLLLAAKDYPAMSTPLTIVGAIPGGGVDPATGLPLPGTPGVVTGNTGFLNIYQTSGGSVSDVGYDLKPTFSVPPRAINYFGATVVGRPLIFTNPACIADFVDRGITDAQGQIAGGFRASINYVDFVSIVCSKSQWVLKGSAPVAPNNDNPNNHLQLFALPFSPTVVPGVVVPAPGFSSLATGTVVSFTADLIAPNTGSTWGELGFRNVAI